MATVRTSFVVFVLGAVLFAVGTGWLTYLNMKSKSVYYSDQTTFGNHIVYSTMIAVVGILCLAFGGVYVVTGL